MADATNPLDGYARCILHADMDAFYAAIEQRDDPELRGKPVIVGGMGRRGVVSTASYEARTFGVRSAMPGSRARALCPDGIFVTPRMDVYAAESATIQAVFAEFTPLVEPLSFDEAFLDVTGSQALFGSGEAIARQLKAKVFAATGLRVSVGVAASKYVAKVASDLDKPDGLVVVPAGEEVGFLAPLPVARLWGAGPVLQKRLASLGIRTIGDLQQRSREELEAALGAVGAAHFGELAHGRDPRRVEPERRARSISHETTFDVDVGDDDRVHAVMLRLAEGVGRRLRAAALRGGLVRLKIRFPPFETHTRQAKLPAPTDDDLVIHTRALELLGKVRAAGQPVRLIGVGVSDLIDAEAGGVPIRGGDGPRQQELFGDPATGPDAAAAPPQKSADLLRAMDRIRDRFGDGAIRRGGAVDPDA